MRERYHIILLVAFTLALYLPSLQSGYLVLDDTKLVEDITRISARPLADLLNYDANLYYRPLILLSYILDARLWGMKASFMHLGNITLHILNALIIYLIARSLLRHDLRGKSIVPMLAAMLFAVHPINTESINWISGRTDPLATVFGLLALYLFCRAWQRNSYILILLSAVSVFVGSLAKEMTFFMNPGFIVILLLMKEDALPLQQVKPWKAWRVASCLTFLTGTGLYLFVRSAGFKNIDKGIEKVSTMSGHEEKWLKLTDMISAFGFYIKKLIIPLPLNFAIDQIDNTAYFWFGLFAIVLSLMLLIRRDFRSACLLFILLTIFPALLNAVLNFAWTPYAERYLYLPSAMLALGLTIPGLNPGRYKKIQHYVMILIIACYLPITLQRNLLWSDHLEFLQVTHNQSPNHSILWNLYAIKLADAGNYDTARGEFSKIILKFPKQQNSYRNLAKMELYIEDPGKARQVLQPFFSGELKPVAATLDTMIKVNEERLKRSMHEDVRHEIRAEMIASYRQRYRLNNRPEYLLSAALLAVDNNCDEIAKEFSQAIINNKTATDELKSKARNISTL